MAGSHLALPLLPGETIQWQGRPGGGLILRPIDGFLIPFSALWCGFVVYWNLGVWGADTPAMFKLFGAAFMVVGVYVLIGRFFVDAYIRSGLSYAVTNRRVIITKRGSSTQSLDIDRLPAVEMSEQPGGYGTIRFGPAVSYFNMGRGNMGYWQPSLDPTPQFLKIADVRTVYETIVAQQRQ